MLTNESYLWHNKKAPRSSTAISALVAINLFAIAFMLFFMRNSEPLLNPTVFAEDGVWTGMGMEHGWLQTAWNARPDYKVVLNVAMLWLAAKTSYIFTGSHIEGLAFFIAIFSYAFFAAIATLGYLATQGIISHPLRIVLYILIVMAPVGLHGNEIFGRILQIGFFLPLASIFLLMIRDQTLGIIGTITIDAILVLFVITNPVVALLVFLYAALYLLKNRNLLATIKSLAPLCLISLTYIIAVKDNVRPGSSLPIAWDQNHAVEAIVARSVLYPFVHLIYRNMTDVTSIVLLVVFITLIACALYLSRRNGKWFILAFSAASLFIYVALTFKMRGGLTTLLNGYNSTFPDRYFVGINLIAMLCFVLALSIIIESAGRNVRIACYSLLALIVFSYVWKASSIFERGRPTMVIYQDKSFGDRLCAAKKTMDGLYSQVLIEPAGWSMKIPNGELHLTRCP
ncbi:MULTISPECIES: hypothetical protein [Pseudomonas]|uniref:Uncharacterized protein n=1 Tax=Pseudomonas luteola TaxID=47886 RepID=A0A2X2CL42_PSELU|nr:MULTISPECIES: hypothetical protein [Pseudomonas]ENA29997.1 hypothetical protein HMPREF1487_08251 [Pseudomonas sp. HPB0071]MBA1247436.1 hypothetical protein [Pseudomonas zeshuii]QEU28983.1 hypothetical protein FOB45_14895 [Pseudomonas luteola]RRW41234.1 hypothetical protein EGJ50_22945 [Pseudomonas luteola]SHJ66869.1 hypothetical protein SAMN05216295_12163 [Pseudomonas zeshuii]